MNVLKGVGVGAWGGRGRAGGNDDEKRRWMKIRNTSNKRMTLMVKAMRLQLALFTGWGP